MAVSLTWQPGSGGRGGRWRKTIGGRVHYFSCGAGRHDESARLAAESAAQTLLDAQSQPQAGSVGTDRLRGLFLRYAAFQLARARAGEISISRHNSICAALRHFQSICGTCSLSEQSVALYHLGILQALASPTPLSRHSVASYFKIIRQFAEWAHRNCGLSPPRNLSDLAIHVPAPELDTLSPCDVMTIFARATARQRLYVLLALNCGLTGGDIGRLRADWLQPPYLAFQRPKTARCASAMPVKYLMWPSSLRAISEAPRGPDGLLLASATGRPLWPAPTTRWPAQGLGQRGGSVAEMRSPNHEPELQVPAQDRGQHARRFGLLPAQGYISGTCP